MSSDWPCDRRPLHSSELKHVLRPLIGEGVIVSEALLTYHDWKGVHFPEWDRDAGWPTMQHYFLLVVVVAPWYFHLNGILINFT